MDITQPNRQPCPTKHSAVNGAAQRQAGGKEVRTHVAIQSPYKSCSNALALVAVNEGNKAGFLCSFYLS